MKLKLEAKEKAPCIEYFKVKFEEEEYLLEDFSRKFKTEDFSLDKLLKKCVVTYRGKEFDYKELGDRNKVFSEKLLFFTRYSKELYPIEYLLSVSNHDYYRSSKYVEKIEKCLQTARYYLLKSNDSIKTDFDVNWDSGYGPQFLLRTLDFSTSVVWYNSCFDYVLLAMYFAFGLYKKMDGYSDADEHEKLLKRCTYYSLGEVYSMYKENQEFKKLWKLINKCYNSLNEVNKWANYLKHKGGITYEGLYPKNPFVMKLQDSDGKFIEVTNEYDSVTIDLDESIEKLADAHSSIYQCINELVDFISFNDAIPKYDEENGVLVIPDKKKYMKIVI